MNIILSEILIYSIFLLLVSVNYYVFSIITSKFIITERAMFIPNVIEGLINGCIVVALELLALYWLRIDHFYIVLSLSIFIIIRTWPVFMGTILPPMILQWFFHDKFQYSEIFILAFVISILFLLSAVKKIFFHKMKIQLYFIPINLCALMIAFILSRTIQIVQINFLNYLSPMLFLVFFFFIYYYLLSFWKSANSLIDVSIYDYDRFYRIKTSRDALGGHIQNNKISNGMFLLFSLQDDDNLLKEEEKELILKNAEKHFDKFNSIYFKISKNEYGIFFSMLKIPNLKRSINGNVLMRRRSLDALQEVERTILDFNKSVNKNYLFGSVIYGIQESDFNGAFDKARFALNSSKVTGKNTLSLFNPYYYNKYKLDLLLMKKLNKEVLVSHVSTKYQLCVTNKGDVANMYLAAPSIPQNLTNINIKQILSYSRQVGTGATLTRYLAAETIRNFGSSYMNKKTKIMLRYSVTFLSSDNFNVNVFTNIIKFHNVKPENVIIIIKLDSIKRFIQNSLLRKNLKLLRANKIHIAISHFDYISDEWKVVKRVHPDYILINNWFYGQKLNDSPLAKLIKFSRSINVNIIAHEIADKKELNNIIAHNIDILCGDYIQNGMSYPIKINRKDKLKIKRRIHGN